MQTCRPYHYAVLLALWAITLSALQADGPPDVFEESFARTSALIVPGRIMDRDVTCTLDTGASTCVLDTRFAATLPNSVGTERVGTSSGRITVDRYEQISRSFMEFPQSTGPAVAIDLSDFSLATGMQIDAILGMDCLKRLVFQVSNGTPRFRTAEDFRPDSNATSNSIKTTRGCPFIAVGLPTLGDRQFLIDTGHASYCGITREYVSRLIRTNDAMLLEEIPTLDASGVQKKNLYVIREIKVFGITMYDVPAEESDVNGLGLGLMRHLNFSIDFQNSVAYVLPPSRLRDSFDLDASGLRIVFQRGRGQAVRRIVPDSPAEKNKIHMGDQLLEIDGHIASELSAWEIRKFLSQAGKTIPIKVKSGEQVRDIQLPLRRNFEYPPKWKPRSTQADDFQKFIESESKAAPK